MSFKQFISDNFQWLFALLHSRKFYITVAGAAGVIFALDIPDWGKGVLIAVFTLGLVFSIAYEDGAQKGQGVEVVIEQQAPESPIE